MAGTLFVRPLAAQLARDVTFIGKMDPYIEFHVGAQKVKSLVCQGGGINPIWEEEKPFILNITNEATMRVDLKESKWVGADPIVGTCEVNLFEVRNKRHHVKWYPLVHQNSHAGKVLFEAIFEPAHTGNNISQSIHQQIPQIGFIGGTNQTIQPVSNGNYPFGQSLGPNSQEPINQNWEYVHPASNQVNHGYQPQVGQQQGLQHTNSLPVQNSQPESLQHSIYAPPGNHNVEVGFTQKYPNLDNQQSAYNPYNPYNNAPLNPNPNAMVGQPKKEEPGFFGNLKKKLGKEADTLF